MGVLQRFERRLEGLVEGAFARAFKGHVEPVEIAGALQREAEDKKAIVGPGRTLVPNDYVVELGQTDYARLAPYSRPLGAELAEMIREAAGEEHWSFVGPVRVELEEIADLETGVFRVRSGVAAGDVLDGGVRHTAGVRGATGPDSAESRQTPGVFWGNPRLVLSAGGSADVDTVEARGGERAYPLVKPVTVIGRGHEVDLRITDPGMSRQHARIEIDDDLVFITDLGSTNGTTVDGAPVTGPAPLGTAQRITIGSTVLVYMRDPRPADDDDA